VAVSFGSKTTLDIPALSIDLTERTAIVGDVGSGKSLLLELLSGERPPTHGTLSIELSTQERRPLWGRITHALFRGQIAYSPQQPFLSNTSLRKNIDLGDDVPPYQVQAAAEAAQLAQDIGSFSGGIEEEVGETGINLSGGQKQRVSLARAFASRRPIFLLDDPLSAVDHKTEIALMAQITRVASGLVLVSHRLDELRLCHRVLVLREGRIVEDGSPEALRAQIDSAFNAFLSAAQKRQETAGGL